MEACLFCKIIDGEIPSKKVYEDEATVAFWDIDPKAPTHLIVVPKEHYSAVHEVPENSQLFANLMSAVSKVVTSENLAEKGYRLVINYGSDGGQTVPHIHVHILAGRSLHWPPG